MNSTLMSMPSPAGSLSKFVICPLCSKEVIERVINEHIDNGCSGYTGSSSLKPGSLTVATGCKVASHNNTGSTSSTVAPIFNMGKKTEYESQSQRLPNHSHKRPSNSQETHIPKRTKLVHLEAAAPLAEKLRPMSLSQFVGQRHLVGPDSLLTTTLSKGPPGSIIFWGPPGCGKTTLARIVANQTGCLFKELSATGVGINEVRIILEEAKNTLALTGKRTILFLDEVHRFNKTQQDIFLPFVEQGHIQLVGATTENPSFKLNSALLSRCRVFVLDRLSDEDMKRILLNALQRVAGLADNGSEPRTSQTTLDGSQQESASSCESTDLLCPSFPHLTLKLMDSIISLSCGDARTAISLLDLVIISPRDSDEASLLASLKRSVSASYDRTGDSRYDMISALHKSVRGSQGSAAMYWLARMLAAGEDPLYIARRMVVCASEDIGLADKHALPLAMSALQACQVVGMPECRINLAHIVAYLSEAPKSTRAYEAYQRAEEAAKLDLEIPVPMQMRNAPTGLLKGLGYGNDYCYNPAYAHPVHNTYLPIQFQGQIFLKEETDSSGKVWDEEALLRWETGVNNGQQWKGRVCE